MHSYIKIVQSVAQMISVFGFQWILQYTKAVIVHKIEYALDLFTQVKNLLVYSKYEFRQVNLRTVENWHVMYIYTELPVGKNVFINTYDLDI